MMRWMWTVVLVGCVADEEPVDPATLAAELEASGTYEVGYLQTELTYQPVGRDEPRTIQVDVWYPADAGDAFAATYSVGGLLSLPADNAFDAPSPAGSGFPVALYSHGSGGVGLLGYPYGERFASHGWVLVAPTHVGNTVLDFTTGGDSFLQSAVDRPQDVRATLDALEAGFDGQLPGIGDTGSTFVFGHSFGAFTTLAISGAPFDLDNLSGVCPPDSTSPDCMLVNRDDVRDLAEGGFGDDRVDAISPQAPAVVDGFMEGGLAAIGIPTLLQSADEDRTTTHEREAKPAWQALGDEEDRWLRIREGGHYSFITICDDIDPALAATIGYDFDSDGCGPDAPPTAELVPDLVTYTLAFAEQHVLDQPDIGGVFELEPLHASVKLRSR